MFSVSRHCAVFLGVLYVFTVGPVNGNASHSGRKTDNGVSWNRFAAVGQNNLHPFGTFHHHVRFSFFS